MYEARRCRLPAYIPRPHVLRGGASRGWTCARSAGWSSARCVSRAVRSRSSRVRTEASAAAVQARTARERERNGAGGRAFVFLPLRLRAVDRGRVRRPHRHAADAGNTFAGWVGDCSGTGTCTVAMDVDHTVSALFGAPPPPPPPPPGTFRVTVNLVGNGSGRVTSNPEGIDCPGVCTMTPQSGTSVALTAQPASGSTFAGWGGACHGSGSCALTASGGAATLQCCSSGRRLWPCQTPGPSEE